VACAAALPGSLCFGNMGTARWWGLGCIAVDLWDRLRHLPGDHTV
jgi:hypothetical protein